MPRNGVQLFMHLPTNPNHYEPGKNWEHENYNPQKSDYVIKKQHLTKRIRQTFAFKNDLENNKTLDSIPKKPLRYLYEKQWSRSIFHSRVSQKVVQFCRVRFIFRFSFFGQNDQKQKNQLSCLFIFCIKNPHFAWKRQLIFSFFGQSDQKPKKSEDSEDFFYRK